MSGLDKYLGIKSASDLINQVSDGFFGTDYQKDYSHASKLMRPNGLALAPKQKFLFHVYFSLTDPSWLKSDDKGLVGALVKSVQLPSFSLDTQEYIQYNRKRLVHNRIKYEPITVKFHDDGEGQVLDLWKKYYTYYFADSAYQYSSNIQTSTNNYAGRTDYNNRDIYSSDRVDQRVGWGKTVVTSPTLGGSSTGNPTPAIKPAFFKDIQIYGFTRGGYVSYILINPVITAWRHDTYDYADGAGIMEHECTIQYETVKYVDGSTVGQGGKNIPGFGHAYPNRYDIEPGALGPGSTASTFGTGGLIDTFEGIGTDLANGNIAGAIQKAGASARTFGSVDNLVNVVTGDSVGAVEGETLKGLNAPTRLLNFPTPGGNKNKNSTATPRSSS